MVNGKIGLTHLVVEGPDGRPVVGALTEALGATMRHVRFEHHHFRAFPVALPAFHPRVAVKSARVTWVQNRPRKPRYVSFLSEKTKFLSVKAKVVLLAKTAPSFSEPHICFYKNIPGTNYVILELCF